MGQPHTGLLAPGSETAVEQRGPAGRNSLSRCRKAPVSGRTRTKSPGGATQDGDMPQEAGEEVLVRCQARGFREHDFIRLNSCQTANWELRNRLAK